MEGEGGRESTVVICNRTGEEGGACYAGTSCVMRFCAGGRVEIVDVCGRAEERVMLVDLEARAKFALERG